VTELQHHLSGVADPDHWDPTACSVLDDVIGEPAYGTASVARGWVALEQPGPWGRDVARQSHLDPELGGQLSDRLAAAGGRLVLIRGTGQHADDHHGRAHTVLVACVVPGHEWLAAAVVEDPQALLGLDVEAVVAGDLDAVRRSLPGLEVLERPVFLVCTNGRRDVCCAVRGRPVADEAAQARPGQVWETSHTGGHRFAPTGVMLPTGSTLARLHADDVVAALDAADAGELPAHLIGPRHDRGRSALTQVEQVADCAVRAATGETRLDAVVVESIQQPGTSEEPVEVVVRRESGQGEMTRFRAVVRRERRLPDRRVSCGKPAEEQVVFTADIQEL
jgi:hypothetical protein